MKIKNDPSTSSSAIPLAGHQNEIIPTPWDSRIFGIETFEIRSVSAEVLEQISKKRGHYTAKVDPLSSKKILHDYGFYYCDTLIEPYCARDRFVDHKNDKAQISRDTPLSSLLQISHGAYLHGRFHRDFNIDSKLADARYNSWLKDLYAAGFVFSLTYAGVLAGFFGYTDNRILLHALKTEFQGKGLAKYLWSAACRELFGFGHTEITSSISTSNAPALNLYASLGFRFRNPRDVYHYENLRKL